MKKTIQHLNGWDHRVAKTKGNALNPDGSIEEQDIWDVVLVETVPPTGDEIHYKITRPVRDDLVRQLTGGIVLAGGDLPNV